MNIFGRHMRLRQTAKMERIIMKYCKQNILDCKIRNHGIGIRFGQVE